MPADYADAQADGAFNPLSAGPTQDMPGDPARWTTRSPRESSELAPLAQEVDDLLELGQFVDFSSQIQDIHDRLHPWTGGDTGDMSSVATSAYDPIFWAHHCMIDRIWYLWQLKWGLTAIPPEYLDLPLAPFAYTVKEVLDPRALGYEYASSTASAPIDFGGEGKGEGGGEETPTEEEIPTEEEVPAEEEAPTEEENG